VASPDLGLTDTRQAVKTAAQALLAAENSSFCNPPATPRNALCPCGSGAKYKRCCGKNAPSVLRLKSGH
jgi:uncharacterized protein YecA (UPF0149 family)